MKAKWGLEMEWKKEEMEKEGKQWEEERSHHEMEVELIQLL